MRRFWWAPILVIGFAVWGVNRVVDSWRPHLLAEKAPGPLAFSPDGRWLVAADVLVNLETGKKLVLRIPAGARRADYVTWVAFSPLGTRLLGRIEGGKSQRVVAVDTSTGKTVSSKPLKGPSGDPQYADPSPMMWRSETELVAFSDLHIVVLDSGMKTLSSIPVGHDFSESLLRKSAFSGDGSRLVIESDIDNDSARQSELLVFATDTGKLLRVIHLDPKMLAAGNLMVSRDGKFIGYEDVEWNIVGVFESETGKLLWKKKGVELQLSQDGEVAIFQETVDGKGTREMLDARTGALMRTLEPERPSVEEQFILMPDGHSIAKSDAEGNVWQTRIR